MHEFDQCRGLLGEFSDLYRDVRKFNEKIFNAPTDVNSHVLSSLGETEAHSIKKRNQFPGTNIS